MRVALLGAAVFFVAQVVLRVPWLIPTGNLVARSGSATLKFIWTALLVPLTAGVFEEVGRWVGYKRLLPIRPSRDIAVMYGLGHGGLECGLLGLNAIALGIAGWAIASGRTLGLSVAGVAAVKQQLHGQSFLWLLFVVERMCVLIFHTALSVAIRSAVVLGRARVLFYAILAHAFVDAISHVVLRRFGAVAAEGVLLIIGLLSFEFVRHDLASSRPLT